MKTPITGLSLPSTPSYASSQRITIVRLPLRSSFLGSNGAFFVLISAYVSVTTSLKFEPIFLHIFQLVYLGLLLSDNEFGCAVATSSTLIWICLILTCQVVIVVAS